ncbi:MAG: phytanoyl-CoA dioxygenase family protein [Woeseiaceae bacterium]
MNDQEKYLFDLRGYLVVKNALNDDLIAALTKKLLEDPAAIKRGFAGSDRTRYSNKDVMAWSSRSLLEYGGPFIDLIDLPTIKPYLEFLMQPHYRLDHDYLKIDRAGTGELFLHGGGQGAGRGRDHVGPHDGGQCYYRYNNEKMYNGLVAVAFELKTVKPGDGGFACVAGSHKANYGLPEEWRIRKTQADIHECVDHVAAEAGDAIIFTEACAHGTIPWQGNDERWTLFYKYCPHAVAWSPCYYNADNYEGLTEQQRLMLMPPSAYGPHEHTREIWERAQQEQAELKELRAQQNQE